MLSAARSSSSSVPDRNNDRVSTNDELIFKIALLGSSGSGKSTLLRALIPKWKWPSNSVDEEGPRDGLVPSSSPSSPSTSPFLPSTLSSWRRTVGVEFASRVIAEAKPGVDIRLQFWDTGGDDSLHYTPVDFAAVLRGTALALVVFDSTSPTSFRTAIDVYLPLLEKHAPHLTPECVVIIENKIDLRAQVEAAKNAMPVAMRRLKKAVSASTSEQNGTEAPTAQSLVDVELVDVPKAQAELFQRIPDAGYVEVHRGDVEKIEFLLSGVVDLLLGLPQSVAFLAADNNDEDEDDKFDEGEVITIGSLASQRAKPSSPSAPPPATATKAEMRDSVPPSATVAASPLVAAGGSGGGVARATSVEQGSKTSNAVDPSDEEEERLSVIDDRRRDSYSDKDGDEEQAEDVDNEEKEDTESEEPSDAPPFSPASGEEDHSEDDDRKPRAAPAHRHQDPQPSEFVAVHPTVAAKGSRLTSWRTTTSRTSPGRPVGKSAPPAGRASSQFREVDDAVAARPAPGSDAEGEEEAAEPEIVVSEDDSNDSTETRQRKRRLRTLEKKRKKLLKQKQKQKQQQSQSGGCGCCAVQ